MRWRHTERGRRGGQNLEVFAVQLRGHSLGNEPCCHVSSVWICLEVDRGLQSDAEHWTLASAVQHYTWQSDSLAKPRVANRREDLDQLVFEYLNGKLPGHIHDLRFHQGENTLLEGTGPLLIGENQRLMIEICAPAPPGEDPRLLSGLTDRSRPVQFSGSFVGTPIRQPFKVRGTLGGGRRGHCAAANHRWWRHDVDEIEFQFRSIDLGRCRFHGVVQPWPNYALSVSRGVIKDENALFGEVVAHYQCWSFDFENFKIAIRDNAIHRIGEIVAEGPSSEGQSLEKLADAVLKGISLRWGYEMEWLCNSFEIADSHRFRPVILTKTASHSL